MRTIKNKVNLNLLTATIFFTAFILSSCKSDDPVKEDVPELITKVVLTFTPTGGGTPVVASATDPDGEGVQDILVNGAINLSTGTSYSLTLSLINELAEPSSPEYNIADEVEEEGDEHMFFFGWTGNVFSDPAGDGNIDSRTDDVNYQDEDTGGFPIGLSTFWTAGSPSTGTFRLLLKHQPDLKTATSDSSVGETDLDVEFEVIVN